VSIGIDVLNSVRDIARPIAQASPVSVSRGALLIGAEKKPREEHMAGAQAKWAAGARWVGGWSTIALSWMIAAFLIAVASAAVVLTIFGAGERGTTIALRVTARWSFVLFWFAYSGSAMARLFGSHLAGLAHRGRDFGLAFASAQIVHVGLVLWVFYLAPRANGGMVFFWVGILCTYLLALFSLPLLRGALGPRLWRISCMIAMYPGATLPVVSIIQRRRPADCVNRMNWVTHTANASRSSVCLSRSAGIDG
jgi:hypothetical protein